MAVVEDDDDDDDDNEEDDDDEDDEEHGSNAQVCRIIFGFCLCCPWSYVRILIYSLFLMNNIIFVLTLKL